MDNRKRERQEWALSKRYKGNIEMFRNKTASQHSFAIVPRADIPRSRFKMKQTRKQAFNASELVPIMVEEILPGDTWQHHESIMARLATPIAPAIDDIHLETFYFFVANRNTWTGNTHKNKWEQFISLQDDALTIPMLKPTTSNGAVNQVLLNGVLDHMGILPQAQSVDSYKLNVLPIWAYFNIYNEWFRDQNLQSEWEWPLTWTYGSCAAITQNGTGWNQQCLRANKRHDYFTSSLPWPQKGDPVEVALGGLAPVVADQSGVGTHIPSFGGAGVSFPGPATRSPLYSDDNYGQPVWSANADTPGGKVPMGYLDFNGNPTPSGLVADLTGVNATTINALRVAWQTQKLLERLARGGSRYVEVILAQFGVRAPDGNLNRPEYLGGSKIPITVNPIAQTAAYDAEPSDAASPVGNLGAEMHARGSKRTFSYAATQHGYIIGLAVVRATPTYQQGTRRHWRRETALDFYNPVFNSIGEQAVATQEIYQPADDDPANATWGYQERHGEYRYTPNEITGVLRSTAAQPMDWWHYSEEFANEPALNAAFITDKTQETLARSLATAPSAQWSAQIIMDVLHESNVARLMPAYGVPGLVDHF